MIVVRKKYGRIRKTENVIVFPGTFEKLVETGVQCVETEMYDQAVEAFDQAITYEPNYPEFLGPYAVALYETKDFIRAKDIATRLLQSGTTNYIDAMELYLTISIQLQEYDEVEMTIDTLVEEGIIPGELLTKFTYLRELNSRLSARYPAELPTIAQEQFTLDAFIKMDRRTQQHALASLEGTDLRAMVPVLEDIVESIHFAPLVVTFALTLLREADCPKNITVQKFGLIKELIPAKMTLPGQDYQTEEVIAELEELLAQDPSKLELARDLIEKFAIIAYPFNWGDYSSKEIAASYLLYIETLFSGDQLPDTELNAFIKQMDLEADLGNM